MSKTIHNVKKVKLQIEKNEILPPVTPGEVTSLIVMERAALKATSARMIDDNGKELIVKRDTVGKGTVGRILQIPATVHEDTPNHYHISILKRHDREMLSKSLVKTKKALEQCFNRVKNITIIHDKDLLKLTLVFDNAKWAQAIEISAPKIYSPLSKLIVDYLSPFDIISDPLDGLSSITYEKEIEEMEIVGKVVHGRDFG